MFFRSRSRPTVSNQGPRFVAALRQEAFFGGEIRVPWQARHENRCQVLGMTYGQLSILVQEPGCPIPSWQQVVDEEAIMDVDGLLEAARRRGEL